jgi:hypothetical protein
MAFTLEQYNKLDEAISQGVLKVEYADKKVEYRSLTEMLTLRRLIAIELGLVTQGGGRKYVKYSSGFEGPCSPDRYTDLS